MEDEKARDARLRRLAKRLGFGLAKVGKRYLLLDGKTKGSYWPSLPHLDPEEVERFLTEWEKNHSGKGDK